jgi:ribulose-5-phosphate 4-epimerase/fuculose-1-phosphate aldolase
MHASNSEPGLDNLLSASEVIGQDISLVQGAGGNLSFKSGSTLWIKASGTRLSEARVKPIFVPLDVRELHRSALVSEDLTAARLSGYPETNHLRPSIETAMHGLLPHTYVFHVHSVSAIAAGTTAAGIERFAGITEKFSRAVVPYAKPGVKLASAIHAVVAPSPDPERPLALLLRNHGLVVGASTAQKALDLVGLIENSLRASRPPRREPFGSQPKEFHGFGTWFSPGTISPTQRIAILAGALTPDSAVFLGPQPFNEYVAGEKIPPCVVAPDGSVYISNELGRDELEIATSLVDVCRQIDPDSVLNTLAADDVDELVNWEAEKWRRQLKR